MQGTSWPLTAIDWARRVIAAVSEHAKLGVAQLQAVQIQSLGRSGRVIHALDLLWHPA
jgi:hypothetical protein